MSYKKINNEIQKLPNKGQVSDGYHTFDELYKHRVLLFLALCKQMPEKCWKYKKNADGKKWDGWFGLGLFPEHGKQITYHLPIEYWSSISCKQFDRNPYYDGHTSADVLTRLKNIL